MKKLHTWPPTFFITGTDTGVGKSVISAILTLGLKGSYWKPVQAGIEPETDTQWIQQITEMPPSHFFPEAYRLNHALSPHAAAAKENIEIELDNIHIPNISGHQPLIVEGAGGVMVPLNKFQYMRDLILHLNIPVILVARTSLGTINHTLLSLETLRASGIQILGVVLNGPRNESNRLAISHYGQIDILAEVEPLNEINPVSIQHAFERCFT